jgi:predicted AlkP superfamily phosphohydrolase/phosphomutase
MTTAPALLVVGLDACDPRVMQRLVETGRAPVLAGLLATATRAPTTPPVGFYQNAIWPTLFTGQSLTRHGFHCYETLAAGSYSHRPMLSTDITAAPFWAELSAAGKRVAAIDVPYSAATAPLNGIQIAEWGVHSRDVGLHTWPAPLADEIAGRFEPHPVGGIDGRQARQFAPCDQAHRAHGARRTANEARALLADLMTGIERKTELSLHYLDQQDWDCFVTVYSEGHCAGHQFWSLHDPTDPGHDPRLAAELGDPVEQVYARLDAAIGEHLDRAGPDTTVVVLLSHGMAPMNSGVFLIDAVLRRLADAEAGREPRSSVPIRTLKAVWQRLPVGARRRLAPGVARRIRRRLRTSSEGLSSYQEVFDRCPLCSAAVFDGTRDDPWFIVPNNTACAGMRLNLAGREPNGVVVSDQADEVSAQLTRDLLDLVKVETGQPLVRQVTRTADHFDRTDDDTLPDLLVEWDRRSPTKTVYSPKTGVVHEPYEHSRTGDHDPDGLLVVAGPGIAAGVELPAIVSADVAPTLCGVLGVDFDESDGHAVPGIADRSTRLRAPGLVET